MHFLPHFLTNLYFRAINPLKNIRSSCLSSMPLARENRCFFLAGEMERGCHLLAPVFLWNRAYGTESDSSHPVSLVLFAPSHGGKPWTSMLLSKCESPGSQEKEKENSDPSGVLGIRFSSWEAYIFISISCVQFSVGS